MLPLDGLFLCPRCSYRRLTPAGRSRAEAKLLATLKVLLAKQRGPRVTVTLRKLVHLAHVLGNDFDSAELHYINTRWRLILRSRAERVAVNGSIWYAKERTARRYRIIYYRIGVEA